MTATRVQVMVNDRWSLWLPPHRAEIPSWSFWERERLAAMYTAIRPGDLVIDVGSEQGDLPALWATWGASVAMMEPNPKVWPNIKQVWDMNGFTPVASFVGFAGEHANGGDPNWPDPHPVEGWPTCAHGEPFPEGGFSHLNERPDVPTVTLDQFAKLCEYSNSVEPHIDVVTIDIEGAELRCLLGAERLLTEDRPVLFVSVHPEFMYDRYRDTADDLLVHMGKMGYSMHLLGIDHEEHWEGKPLPR